MVDETAIGMTFAPVHATVEAGRLRYFFETIGERNPIYRDPAAASAAGFAGIPIPPTYLFCQEMMDAEDPFEFLTRLKVDIGRILHGEQTFVYLAPVVVGDRLVFESSITGVAQKKGGAMTIIEIVTKVTNQAGQHVADAIRSVVVRN